MKERIENSLTLDEVLSNKKYSVNYYQREYRWGRKQIEQLIDDLTDTFDESFNREKHNELTDIDKFDYYYMGTIIVTGKEDIKSIIDGQQRLTSITLLLIALNNLRQEYPETVNFQDITPLINSTRMSIRSFNINVKEWHDCLNKLFENKRTEIKSISASESVQNICNRYDDLIDILLEYLKSYQKEEDKETQEDRETKGKIISFFACWLIYKLIFIRIVTPNEQDAHKVFVSMNDRGLNLNTSEMLKGYLLSEIDNDDEREIANTLWKNKVLELKQSAEDNFNGISNTEDVNFISIWIRAKYAETIREGKKDAKDKDYEIIGREFHEWIRDNHNKIGLKKSSDFFNFINVDFKFYAEIYLRLKEYSKTYSEAHKRGFEEVFFNANKELNYQYMLILSSLNTSDSEDVINKKIKVVSTYIDSFSSRRIFNFAKINWNTIKADLFSTIKKIRGLSLDKLTVYLTLKLINMDYQINGIVEKDFCWNQFTGKYMLHILSRFVDYVDVSIGNASLFDTYINRKIKNSYDREHVLPDKYEDYSDKFSSIEEFNIFRAKLGNLIILKLDKNRSYQDMKYSEKRNFYLTENIIAQSFHEDGYRSPKFKTFIENNKYNFKPYKEIGKNEINERQNLYQDMALNIWSASRLKEISGAWNEEYELELKNEMINNTSCIDLISSDLKILTKKKPCLIELNKTKEICTHYNEMIVKIINWLATVDKDKLIELGKQSFENKLFYFDNETVANEELKKMRNGKETNIKGLIIETHGSSKDCALFAKKLLEKFNIDSLKIYIK